MVVNIADDPGMSDKNIISTNIIHSSFSKWYRIKLNYETKFNCIPKLSLEI